MVHTPLNLPTHKQEAKLNTSAGLNISHILLGIFIVVAFIFLFFEMGVLCVALADLHSFFRPG